MEPSVCEWCKSVSTLIADNELMRTCSCSNVALARAHFPSAIPYMPASVAYGQKLVTVEYRRDSLRLQERYAVWIEAWVQVVSKPSGLGSHPVLEAINRVDNLMFSGGNDDPAIASISVLDFYRVAQLYPKAGVDFTVILNWRARGWDPMSVQLPGMPGSIVVKDSLQA